MKPINQAGEKWQIKRDGLGFSTTRFEVKHDKSGITPLPFIIGSLMHTSVVSREDAELFADKIVRSVNLLEAHELADQALSEIETHLDNISDAIDTVRRSEKLTEKKHYWQHELDAHRANSILIRSALSKLSELKKSLNL